MRCSILVSAEKPVEYLINGVDGWKIIDRRPDRAGNKLFWNREYEVMPDTLLILNDIKIFLEKIELMNEIFVDIGIFIEEKSLMKSFSLRSSDFIDLKNINFEIGLSLYFCDGPQEFVTISHA